MSARGRARACKIFAKNFSHRIHPLYDSRTNSEVRTSQSHGQGYSNFASKRGRGGGGGGGGVNNKCVQYTYNNTMGVLIYNKCIIMTIK